MTGCPSGVFIAAHASLIVRTCSSGGLAAFFGSNGAKVWCRRMGERIDRALALFDRFVGAMERIAEATETKDEPLSTKKPRPKLAQPTDIDRERAARVAKKLGMVAKR